MVYMLVFVVISFIILSPEIYFLVKKDPDNSLIKNIFLVQAFLLIPVGIFFKNLRIYYFLLAVFSSFLPLLFLPLLFLRQAVNADYLILALQSNTREIYELLGVSHLLLLAVAIVFCFWVMWRLCKLLPRKINSKMALSFSVIGLLLFMLLFFMGKDPLMSYTAQAKRDLSNYYPFRLAVNFYPIYRDLSAITNYADNTADFKFGAQKVNSNAKRTIQLLVVGESSRSDHWGINGYTRNTSPNLSKDSNLYSFTNVASGATVTSKAIPLLVTRVGVGNAAGGLHEKSILNAFSEAGFYTAWISNQYVDNKILKVTMHVTDADTIIATNSGAKSSNKFLTANLYDELVLKPVQNIINAQKGDVFMVVHLMGNHFDYKFRYPHSFDVFKSADSASGARVNGYTQTEMVDHYDNSILYNDYVLQSMIDYLKTVDANSALLFVSDHGEDLNDDNNGLYYHMPTPTYNSAHVPLFVWLSDNSKVSFPAYHALLHTHLKQPISAAESVFYTTLNLGGITILKDDNEKKFSLLSSTFEASRQQILGDNNSIYFFKDLYKEKH